MTETMMPEPIPSTLDVKAAPITGVNVLLVILMLISLGLAGFMWWQNKELRTQITELKHTEQQKIAENTAIPSPTITQIGDWKIYDNKINGVSFKYPSAWILGEDGKIKTDNNYYLVITTETDTSPLISDYLVKRDKISATAYEGQPSVQVKSTKKSKVNDLSYIQREEYLIAADFTEIATYFKSGDKVIRIALELTPGYGLNDDGKVYNQILASFTLL
jgi:hypothetical protein